MPTDEGEGRLRSCRPVAREASDHEPPRALCPRCGARVELAAGGTGAAPPEIKSAALRARLRRFEAYTPAAVARRLLHGLREALVTSAVECRATVMFTDIAGFTALTEGWPPAAVAAFLDDHFALVAGGIEAEGGTVGTFLGDGVMSFWVAAAGHEDHALRAARAALRIARAVTRDNGRRTARGEAPVRLRIGVHTGPVVLGPIGSPSRVTRTVVGDTVNVAQRLEQLAKDLPAAEADADEVAILVSDGTAADLGGCFPLHPVGRVRLRGRQEGADAFQIRADGWIT